jgi:hypothetical protein
MRLTVSHPQLRLELAAMAMADQDMRNNAIHGTGTWDSSLDKQHTKALKRIIAQYGWPTIAMVGVDGSLYAWLIAQHADHDVGFQKACLALMKKLPAKEVSPRNIAYLEDRVLVAEHKPQLYGTQFAGTGPDTKPLAIEDEAHVEERRQQMGLETLEEYTRLMREDRTATGGATMPHRLAVPRSERHAGSASQLAGNP